MKLEAGWKGLVDLLDYIGLCGSFPFSRDCELLVEKIARGERKRRDIKPTIVGRRPARMGKWGVSVMELLQRLSRSLGSCYASR
jgi:hypothetical protein